jgi:hypothetical protein
MQRPASTMDDADRPTSVSSLRGLEARELLRAVTALHLDGMLSEAEFQAKRQRLIAWH